MFSVSNPLVNIEDNQKYKIFDSHTHIWSHRFLNQYLEYSKSFGVDRILGIGNQGLKKKL